MNSEETKTIEVKKKSHKALIFNIFYIIFAAMSITAGSLLGKDGILGFLNNPIGLPEAIADVNGWSLLSVVLVCFFIFIVFLEQKSELWLYGLMFFLAMLTSSIILSFYPVTGEIAISSSIFMGECVLVGGIITFILYLLFLPLILILLKKKKGDEKEEKLEENKNDDLKLVYIPSENDNIGIHPALPSIYIRRLHKDGIYLRSKRNYLPLTEQTSIYGNKELVYHGYIEKGYFSFIKIVNGREIDIPEETDYGRGWTLEGKAQSIFKGTDVLECDDLKEKRSFNYINRKSSWKFGGDEDKKYRVYIRLYDQETWAVIYGQEE